MSTRLYDVYIHETAIHRLTVEADNASTALEEAATVLETDRHWRTRAELVSGGTFRIHSVHPSNESNNHD